MVELYSVSLSLQCCLRWLHGSRSGGLQHLRCRILPREWGVYRWVRDSLPSIFVRQCIEPPFNISLFLQYVRMGSLGWTVRAPVTVWTGRRTAGSQTDCAGPSPVSGAGPGCPTARHVSSHPHNILSYPGLLHCNSWLISFLTPYSLWPQLLWQELCLWMSLSGKWYL